MTLNQIPHDYIVEVTNRFKGLDLVERMPEELWTGILNIVQGRLKTFGRILKPVLNSSEDTGKPTGKSQFSFTLNKI